MCVKAENRMITHLVKHRFLELSHDRTFLVKHIKTAFVMKYLDDLLSAWECLHDCESCGKCRILKGKDAETLYADYIEGKRSYIEITLDIRNNSY